MLECQCEQITAACFPTPALLLRTNDPVAQRGVRVFAHKQARAAARLHQELTKRLAATRGVEERTKVFTMSFEALEYWRYEIALSSPTATGRYGTCHAERFRTPITDEHPNLFRIGEHERYRDGTTWDAVSRTYVGGIDTPASETMRRVSKLAVARFGSSSDADVVVNHVTLTNGQVASGTRLLRHAAARDAATEMRTRIAARGGDTSRIITDGDDLLYIASAPQVERKAIFRGATMLLADRYSTIDAALSAWAQAAYLLYQAPRTKRGSDATIRTLLVAAGAHVLGYPPTLPQDIDLFAYVRPQHTFMAELIACQLRAKSGPDREAGTT